MDKNELRQRNKTNINLINKDLTDIKDIHIDSDAPYIDRLMSFTEQTKNFFCFMCEGVVVKINYAPEGKSLEETLTEHFSKFKS